MECGTLSNKLLW